MSSDDGVVLSATAMFVGEEYITRIRVSNGVTLENQMTGKMGRVIWNYAILTEYRRLASIVIATRKNHQHSKRNK